MANKEVEQLARAYFKDKEEGKEPDPIAVNLASTMFFESVVEVISQDGDLAPETIKTLLKTGGKIEASERGEIRIEVDRGDRKKYFSLIASDSIDQIFLGYKDEELTEYVVVRAYKPNSRRNKDTLPGFLYFKKLSNEESGQIEDEKYDTDARAFDAIRSFLNDYEVA